MTVHLKKPAATSVPIVALEASGFGQAAAALPPASRRWLETVGFRALPDTHALLPGEDGTLAAVWAGVRAADQPWSLAMLPRALPEGPYHLAAQGLAMDPQTVAMAWQLGAYAFDRYKRRPRGPAQLHLAPSAGAERGLLLADATARVRDLVNTPAEHMGPQELADAVQAVGGQHKARVRQVVGDELLKHKFPAIHAVGRAATRAPRLIELDWGRARDPLLVLVGKGVCFDSGGLDIKPADGMRLMKKDMGGAAHALALAQLVMATKLPVRLKLLIPAVENAVSGNAMRPGDVFETRKGLHIEIGNTDAEGRVILCDALAYGAEGQPDLIIDLATLTGAARVALGTQLPALFARRMDQARDLVDRGLALQDPLWHLPLWRDYRGGIESDIADLVNTGKGPAGGAISAALFLDAFVPETIDWLHVDLYAWNDSARPGRPVGGDAQGLRTLLDWLQARYAPR